MMKPLVTSFALALFGLTSLPALAHGDEPHGNAAHPPKGAAAPTTAPAAEHKKEHPRPHGGQVFVVDTADHMHAEAVFEEGGLHLWFYDDQMKPIAAPAEAKATLVVGKEVRKLDLKPMEKFGDKPDAHVGVATALPKDGKLALVVQATVNGKPRSGRVEREPPATTATAAPAPPKTH